MRLIPAIDIIDGQCIRLTKGNYSTKKIYSNDPISIAKSFEDANIKHLHLVDLDGARLRKIVNHKILYLIAKNTNLKIDFGGGLHTNEDAKIAFDNGANQIIGGTIAVKKPATFTQWINDYGADKIILAADTKNRKIAINAWQENSTVDIIDFIKYYEKKGIRYVICTDIMKDGTLNGVAKELYTEIQIKNNINLIASGGVSSLNDLKELKRLGCEGAIFGKAFYENKITLEELRTLQFD